MIESRLRGAMVGNEELARYVRGRRLALDMTQGEVASASHGAFTRSWVASVENAARVKPEREKLEALAVVLKADPSEILRHAGYRPGLLKPVEERTTMLLLRELEASLRQQPLQVPVSRDPMSAGGGAPLEEYVPYYPPPGKRHHEYRAYEIVGTCLEPRIMRGHLVIVDHDEDPRPGDIVAIAANGTAKVKILTQRNGELWLTALQNEPDMLLTEDVSIIGVVTQAFYKP